MDVIGFKDMTGLRGFLRLGVLLLVKMGKVWARVTKEHVEVFDQN